MKPNSAHTCAARESTVRWHESTFGKPTERGTKHREVKMYERKRGVDTFKVRHVGTAKVMVKYFLEWVVGIPM